MSARPSPSCATCSSTADISEFFCSYFLLPAAIKANASDLPSHSTSHKIHPHNWTLICFSAVEKKIRQWKKRYVRISITWWVDADIVKFPASLELDNVLDTFPVLVDNVSDEVDAVVGEM